MTRIILTRLRDKRHQPFAKEAARSRAQGSMLHIHVLNYYIAIIGIYGETKMSEGTEEVSGYAFGALDAIVLVIALIVGAVVIIKYRQRKKKESDELRSLHISAR